MMSDDLSALGAGKDCRDAFAATLLEMARRDERIIAVVNDSVGSTKLAEFLLDKVRVAVVPGVEFGLDGYLRISYCGGIKDIREGVERMKWALDPNAPNELFIGDRKLVRDWS